MIAPPDVRAVGTTILDGPRREGSELHWHVQRADGSVLAVAMLVPELSAEPALRRRWLADVARMRAMTDVEGLLPILSVGPRPDPADPNAAPPWRVRAHWPHAQTFEAWLSARAPMPIEAMAAQIGAIANVVHRMHRYGVVLRDLHPRRILIDDQGQIALADVGLSRVDVLSSRTAASLILEASPYAAPEQFARTCVDQRSDVYGLGVLAFRALTGTLPYGDEAAILRGPGTAPRLASLRADIPAELDAFIARCLHDDPQQRPGSAQIVAHVLAGDPAGDTTNVANVPCQHCGQPLRTGQRLCIGCGRIAVRFAHHRGDRPAYEIVLEKIGESAKTHQHLREVLHSVSDGPPPDLNFIIGDARMYSAQEQKRRTALPVPIVQDVDEATAVALLGLIDQSPGLTATTRPQRSTAALSRKQKRALAGVVAFGLVAALGTMAANVALGSVLVVATILCGFIFWGTMRHQAGKAHARAPLIALRQSPAALPASDPLVARLAALLGPTTPADIRDEVGALALALQTLVDHRAQNLGEAGEIDAVTAPLSPLVALIESQVGRVAVIDDQLRTLDEGQQVRALAAARARADADADPAAATILDNLDRVRTLEDARAAALHRLLEAGSLMRRATRLGTGVVDEEAIYERNVALALHALRDDASHV